LQDQKYGATLPPLLSSVYYVSDQGAPTAIYNTTTPHNVDCRPVFNCPRSKVPAPNEIGVIFPKRNRRVAFWSGAVHGVENFGWKFPPKQRLSLLVVWWGEKPPGLKLQNIGPWSEAFIRKASESYRNYQDPGVEVLEWPEWVSNPEIPHPQLELKEPLVMKLSATPLKRHVIVDVAMDVYTIAVPVEKLPEKSVYIWNQNRVPSTTPRLNWALDFREWLPDFFGPLKGNVLSVFRAIRPSKFVVLKASYAGGWESLGGRVDSAIAPHQNRFVSIFATADMAAELTANLGVKSSVFIYEGYNEELEKKYAPDEFSKRKRSFAAVPETVYEYLGPFPNGTLGPNFESWIESYVAGKLQPTPRQSRHGEL